MQSFSITFSSGYSSPHMCLKKVTEIIKKEESNTNRTFKILTNMYQSCIATSSVIFNIFETIWTYSQSWKHTLIHVGFDSLGMA